MTNQEILFEEPRQNKTMDERQAIPQDNYNNYKEPEARRFNNRHMSPRAFTPRIRYTNSLMKSSAPFNYYSNPNGTDGYVICYNGGYMKRFHPLVTRTDLAKYLQTRNLYGNRQKAYFQKPENYFLPKPNCVPNPVVDRLYNKSHDNFYPARKRMRYEKQPIIPRYTAQKFVDFNQTSRAGERPKMINYNLNNNNALGQQRYPMDRNPGLDEQFQNNTYDMKDNVVPPKIQNQRQPKENVQNDKKVEEKPKMTSIFKPRTYRTFHKVQIFNNYKPFLVDSFNEYADYC